MANNKMRTKQNTVICPKYWKMSKKFIYNQPKSDFFHKIIVKSFRDAGGKESMLQGEQ
jgi:hypothetical protein